MKKEYDTASLESRLKSTKDTLEWIEGNLKEKKKIEEFNKEIKENPEKIKKIEAELNEAYEKLPKNGFFSKNRPKKGEIFKNTKNKEEYNDAGIAYNQVVSKLNYQKKERIEYLNNRIKEENKTIERYKKDIENNKKTIAEFEKKLGSEGKKDEGKKDEGKKDEGKKEDGQKGEGKKEENEKIKKEMDEWKNKIKGNEDYKKIKCPSSITKHTYKKLCNNLKKKVDKLTAKSDFYETFVSIYDEIFKENNDTIENYTGNDPRTYKKAKSSIR